jgi:TorA maturation chaperone TorD
MTLSQATNEEVEAPPPGKAVPVFRSVTWFALAATLRNTPDPALLAHLIDTGSGTVDDGAEPGELGQAWSAVATAAGRVEHGPLDDEFHDLFIGIGRGELVPYASWYRTGFLMDRPLVALRRDLALLGFERQHSVREPEDHAAAIAEVMGLLADPAEGQDESTQRLFFSEHIDSWMPDFFADMQTAQSADFYRAVGRLGAAFVEFERGWLGAEAPRGTASHSGVSKS